MLTSIATESVIHDIPVLTEAMHRIDFEDVAVSPAALEVLRRAASKLLDRFEGLADFLEPGFDPKDLTSSHAVALFIDRIFWDERTGDLIMCSMSGGDECCVPIPREHWSLRRQTPIQ